MRSKQKSQTKAEKKSQRRLEKKGQKKSPPFPVAWVIGVFVVAIVAYVVSSL